MFNRLNDRLYGFLSAQRLRQTDLFHYVGTAEDYGKVYMVAGDITGPFDGNGKLTVDCDTEPIFIKVMEMEGTHVIFYQNLFFLLSLNNETNDAVVQIYVKRPEDNWRLPVNEDGTLDYINPLNVKVDVYVNYDVSVIKLGRTLGRCGGEFYRNGTWGKMVYKTLNSFFTTVENYTEISQIKHAYEK